MSLADTRRAENRPHPGAFFQGGRGFDFRDVYLGYRGAVERHMLGFQAAYARRGIKLDLGEWLALGYQSRISLRARSWHWATTALGVRRDKAALSSGCKPHPAIRSSRKQPEQAWRRRNV